MKILLVTSYRDSWPYIPELRDYLESTSNQADILDIFNMEYLNTRHTRFFYGQWRERLFRRIPLINRLLKMLLFPLFFFFYAKKIISSYDIINIHYVSAHYRYIIRSIRLRARNLITTVWGSDLLRAKPTLLFSLKPIFNASDNITFLNPQICNKFVDFYHSYRNKTLVIRFGLRSVEYIKKIMSLENRIVSKKKLNLPINSFIITIGYSGSPAQQHDRILTEIASCNFPKNIFLLIPMTYAVSSEYKSNIEAILKKSGLPFRIITTRLSDDDVARLRIVSDIVINFQKTDQLSASLQEHLYAGNVMIAAEWLPYQIFSEQNIFYISSSWKNLKSNLDAAIKNISILKQKTAQNQNLMYSFSSWQSNGRQWLQLFENVTHKINI